MKAAVVIEISMAAAVISFERRYKVNGQPHFYRTKCKVKNRSNTLKLSRMMVIFS